MAQSIIMRKLRFISLTIALSTIMVLNFNCSKDNQSDLTNQDTDSIVVAMNAGGWDYYGTSSEKYYIPTAGVFEIIPEGVKGFGQLYRYGAFLVTREGFDLNKKTFYMKWKGNNANEFCAFVISLTNSGYIYSAPGGITNYTDLGLYSAPNSFGGSVVVSTDTWYYTTVSVVNNQFTTKTATGNYADKGGTAIDTRTGSLNNSKGSISLRAGDPYAGSSAYVIVGELKIK